MGLVRAVVRVCSLALLLGAPCVWADPFQYTMRVTDNGMVSVGDPQGVVGFVQDNGAGSFANTIDALTPTLFAAAASGTPLDLVEFIGFDAGTSPPPYIGTYRFFDVLITGLVVDGTTLRGEFTAAETTFEAAPEPATLHLLAVAVLALLLWRRELRRVVRS